MYNDSVRATETETHSCNYGSGKDRGFNVVNYRSHKVKSA